MIDVVTTAVLKLMILDQTFKSFENVKAIMEKWRMVFSGIEGAFL